MASNYQINGVDLDTLCEPKGSLNSPTKGSTYTDGNTTLQNKYAKLVFGSSPTQSKMFEYNQELDIAPLGSRPTFTNFCSVTSASTVNIYKDSDGIHIGSTVYGASSFRNNSVPNYIALVFCGGGGAGASSHNEKGAFPTLNRGGGGGAGGSIAGCVLNLSQTSSSVYFSLTIGTGGERGTGNTFSDSCGGDGSDSILSFNGTPIVYAFRGLGGQTALYNNTATAPTENYTNYKTPSYRGIKRYQANASDHWYIIAKYRRGYSAYITPLSDYSEEKTGTNQRIVEEKFMDDSNNFVAEGSAVWTAYCVERVQRDANKDKVASPSFVPPQITNVEIAEAVPCQLLNQDGGWGSPNTGTSSPINKFTTLTRLYETKCGHGSDYLGSMGDEAICNNEYIFSGGASTVNLSNYATYYGGSGGASLGNGASITFSGSGTDRGADGTAGSGGSGGSQNSPLKNIHGGLGGCGVAYFYY